MSRIAAALIGLAFTLAAANARGAPVLWSIHGAFFGDGGSLNGWFFYDADTRTYSGVELQTFGGRYPGDFYEIWEPSQDQVPGRTLTAWVSTTDGLIGQKELYLPFFTALTNAGGRVNMGFFIEGPCVEISPSTGGVCLIQQSRVGSVGGYVLGQVPLPPAAWLLGSALGALAWARRKLSRSQLKGERK